MKMKPSARITCALVGLMAAAAVATATTLERMSVEQMARAAQAVVRARCVTNTTAWDAGEIWTFTSFDIEESWHGPAGSHIMVRLLGGSTKEFTSHVAGVPRFRPGEEVILFLEPTARGDFSVTGWEQGTFRIHRDAGSGEESVTQDTAGFETFDPATHRFATSGVRRMRLGEFRAQVESATAGAEGQKP